MVAKVKGSFLKKNFQLFCYRHILSHNSKNTTTATSSSGSAIATSSTDSSGLSFSNPISNSTPGSPKLHEKLKSHSKSSPNLNLKTDGANYDVANKEKELKSASKDPANARTKNLPNYTDPKLNYYHNNRKHLSKIIQSKKLTSGKSSQHNSTKPNYIPNSNSAHTLPIPDSDLQLLSDLKENLDLLKRHQKRSKSSINFTSTVAAESNTDINKNNTSNNDKINSNNNSVQISNPNIEIDFINYKKKNSSGKDEIGNNFKQSELNSNEKSNAGSINNNRSNELSSKIDKMDSLLSSTSQIISSTPQKLSPTNLNSNASISLYKNNQSINNLKLAKKMQQMQKFNNENNSVNLSKQIMNGESFSKNGIENIQMSKYDYINSSNTMSRTKFKSSILNTDLAANRRSFSASKKVVRFADALGLELESIITLNQMEETNRRLKLKNEQLRNITITPKIQNQQKTQQNNLSSNNNNNNYVNIDYGNNTSYGEFARELYQKDNLSSNSVTITSDKISVNQYQTNFLNQQAYLNEIMNQISLGNSDATGFNIGGETKVGSTIDIVAPNSTNGTIVKRNKNNQNANNINLINNQNLNFHKRLSEDFNNVNSNLKFNLSPQNNLSSNGNSDRDETSSNSSDQLNQEKILNNQYYVNDKFYQYQNQHQQPINYQNYNQPRVSNRNATTLPIYQLKLMKGQINSVNNSKTHVNISNNHENNNNIKITTRINNGKLESEV